MKEDSPLKLAQVLAIIVALAYTTYLNAKEVPSLKQAIGEQSVRIAVLESQMRDIRDSLARIENRLGSRR